ncbi:MAG: hypothetical protein A3A86_07945 [Elusimicrobia bacterium RIFCSPLOWO2_01_FULL_60_11]|nr:MAG: hypothetical protein A3A86_07945 [Elusimicrobia bacterium RIFCSPLOWO2_01_FULL_60_11]
MKRNDRRKALTTPYEDFLDKQLKSPRACVAYLNAALDQDDDEAFLLALRDVARAQGGLSRLSQMAKIHHVMGLKLTVTHEQDHKFSRAA